MSCCNQCMEMSAKSQNGEKVDWSQAQGHYLCGNPTDGQIAAYVYGERPTFHDNRWTAREARPSTKDKKGNQVWNLGGNYFTVINGTAQLATKLY